MLFKTAHGSLPYITHQNLWRLCYSRYCGPLNRIEILSLTSDFHRTIQINPEKLLLAQVFRLTIEVKRTRKYCPEAI